MENKNHLIYELHAENDSEWLLLARKKLNLTQAELGAMVEKKQDAISKIESGILRLSVPFKKLIITLLKERDQYGK